jgi:transposase InsO family protein
VLSAPVQIELIQDTDVANDLETDLLKDLREKSPQAVNTSFSLRLRNGKGETLGGVTASTSYGWLLIKVLFVSPSARRCGNGQMDVKFLTFKGEKGEKVRRFQYTAIDDATRVRALKIYEKHTQANAIDFADHIIEKFPFRIREIRTDNGHEFQAKFHWHVEDLGIRHAYIKRGTPQLNGKVERSHRSDGQEFYQLLSYKDDVDLEAKLDEWERFYNFHRPHAAHNGKTPYEVLREKL